jgi:tetratricopeptide (TPR) repeat protein
MEIPLTNKTFTRLAIAVAALIAISVCWISKLECLKSNSTDRVDSDIDAIRRHLRSNEFKQARLCAHRKAQCSERTANLDETQMELARTLVITGDYEEAIAILSKPVSLPYPVWEGSRKLLLAQALVCKARYKDAIIQLQSAQSLIPPQNSMRLEVCFELGKSYLGLGNRAAAAAQFEELQRFGGCPGCAKLYSRLTDVGMGPEQASYSIVDDLHSFWSDSPFEAIPNLEFAAVHLRKCGKIFSSDVLEKDLQRLKS